MKCLIYTSVLFLLLSACSSHKAGNPTPPAPSAAALTFPAQNSLCVSGNVISATQSSIQLQWQPASNASSYNITVKNLLTGDSTSQSVTQTNATFTLKRNTPFSWYVISNANGTAAIAKSAIWKFYNAGDGVTSYAPFPADSMSPAEGQLVDGSSGSVTLSWTGADPDNDIANYDVYFGTSQSPVLYKGTYTSTSLTNVPVSANTTYYWKIVTRDNNNNTSTSAVIEFQTK